MANDRMVVNRCFGEAEFLFCFTAPYDSSISKNKRYINRQFALNPKHVAACNMVAVACRKAMAGKKLATQKHWIDVKVFKPNPRADAFNIVDGLMDAIKRVLEVDDCHYAGHVDYETDKINPRIEVMIYRSIEDEH